MNNIERLLDYITSVDEAMLNLDKGDVHQVHGALSHLMDQLTDDLRDLGGDTPEPYGLPNRCSDCGCPIEMDATYCTFCKNAI